jgi:hypothetical protein
MTSHRRRIPWVVALTAALLVPGTVPAGAHVHPTPTERAAPAVVYVEARAEVQVALVEHLQSDPGGVHIAIIQSTSNPVLATASGFVVDPTGTIVTSGALTQTDLDRARVYAVIEAFKKQYGDQAPLPGDLFTRQQIGDATNRLQQRLEACYPPNRTNDAGGCVVTVTPTYIVYPYVTSQEQYGQSRAELLPASTPDVAVLRVRGASGMPTVPLGESTEGAKALGVLGFTGVPGELQAINSHLAEVGGSTLKTEGLTEDEMKDAVRLPDALRAGMRGGPVLAEDGRVIGLLEPEANSGPPPATAGRLVDAGAIQDVLSAEGITPRRGPVDTSFEAAMHAFKNGGFAAAIPNLEATLAVFPGHAMAATNLAVAKEKVASGAPGPATPAAGDRGTPATGSASDVPWTVVLLAVAAVLVLAAVATPVLRRRRRTSAGGGVTPSPVAAVATLFRRLRPHASAAGGVAPSPGTPRPREGQPATSSRPSTGARERQVAPTVTRLRVRVEVRWGGRHRGWRVGSGWCGIPQPGRAGSLGIRAVARLRRADAGALVPSRRLVRAGHGGRTRVLHLVRGSAGSPLPVLPPMRRSHAVSLRGGAAG